MTPQQLVISGMMAVIIILLLLVWQGWRQRQRISYLRALENQEARHVHASNTVLLRELREEREIGDKLRRDNRDMASTIKALEAKCETRDRQLSEMVVGRSIYENEVRKAVEDGTPVPTRGPVRGCEASAEANRAAMSQVDRRRSPPPPPAMRQGTDGSRHELDSGSQMLQTAILVSAFDNSPAREKEITDAQNSSHRSAGHEPVCSPSYESRHSGGAGESHSSPSSSDSGSSGSSDSGSPGSCD